MKFNKSGKIGSFTKLCDYVHNPFFNIKFNAEWYNSQDRKLT